MPSSLSSFLKNRAVPFVALLAMIALALAALRYGQHGLPKLPPQVDLGVVALFAPACALMLAILVGAAFFTVRRTPPGDAAPLGRPIPHSQNGED